MLPSQLGASAGSSSLLRSLLPSSPSPLHISHLVLALTPLILPLVQGFFPPAFFNYISKVKKLPLARYYSVSELSLIPDTTNKYLRVGAHCQGAGEGLSHSPAREGLAPEPALLMPDLPVLSFCSFALMQPLLCYIFLLISSRIQLSKSHNQSDPWAGLSWSKRYQVLNPVGCWAPAPSQVLLFYQSLYA